jgi:uncharacterized membrane protein
MQDFIYFLGRFHVLVLHLPIGIILAAVALDWIARSERFRALGAVSPFLWALAAVSAVATAALGYMHLAEGKFSGDSASAHRFFGTSVAVFTVVVWWLSRRPELYKRVNVATGVILLALVTITGHFGGNLTHGSSFLWQYAPGPLHSLGDAITESGAGPAEHAAGTPTNTAAAKTSATNAGADPAVVDRLYRSGFLVRQVSDTDPHLVVSVYSPGARVTEQHIAVLLTAVDQIVELNLQDALLEDSVLVDIGKFTELTRLRLSHNELTDRTVAKLAGLKKLERLNLYSNPGVTDLSIDVLASLPELKRLDVWNTGVTEKGMARLRELRPDLELQGESSSFGVEFPLPGSAD